MFLLEADGISFKSMDSQFFQANGFFIYHVSMCYTSKVVPSWMHVCVLNCQVPAVIVYNISEKASNKTGVGPNIEPVHVDSHYLLNMCIYAW